MLVLYVLVTSVELRVSGKGILQRHEVFSGKTYNNFAIAQSCAAEVTKKNIPYP
jgi:hypothetical protein